MAHRLDLTAEEHKALAWVSDRYISADVLYRGMVETDDNLQDWGGSFDIPEHVAWEYEEELSEENGGGLIVPPCVGGTLADKLIALREGII